MSQSVSSKENRWSRMKSNPLEIRAEYIKMNTEERRKRISATV
jgi:hypothetical protein